MSDRRIRFNGFKCSTVAHTTAGLWRHPDSQSHRYKELSFWVELAKTLSTDESPRFVNGVLGRVLREQVPTET